MSETLADDWRLRILAVLDDFTRGCLNETPVTSLAHAGSVLAA